MHVRVVNVTSCRLLMELATVFNATVWISYRVSLMLFIIHNLLRNRCTSLCSPYNKHIFSRVCQRVLTLQPYRCAHATTRVLCNHFVGALSNILTNVYIVSVKYLSRPSLLSILVDLHCQTGVFSSDSAVTDFHQLTLVNVLSSDETKKVGTGSLDHCSI